MQPPNDAVIEMKVDTPDCTTPVATANSDLNQVAQEFGKYLASLPSKTSSASQACKYVYETYPGSRDFYHVMVDLRVSLNRFHFYKWMVLPQEAVAFCR